MDTATDLRPVVITLHGIRTRGEWQNRLDAHLSRAGFVSESLDYGWFGVIPFLFKSQRNKKVKWFVDEYQRIRRENPGTVPSLIAHSFGAYIAARAIAFSGGMIKFERVIFCGSIVPADFEWSKVIEAGIVKEVLNDFGHLDVWAAKVGLALPDAGDSGYRGFTDTANGKVDQRCHPEWGHGHFFFELNYKERWIPFLKGEIFSDVTLKPHYHFPVVWVFPLFALALVVIIASLGVNWRKSDTLPKTLNRNPTSIPTRALTIVTPSIPESRTLVKQRLIQAEEQSSKADYESAIKLYGEAINLDPKSFEAYFGRAGAYRAQGKYDEAVFDFGDAIRLKANDAQAYYERGKVYVSVYESKRTVDALYPPLEALDYIHKAIDDFSKAIDLDPRNPSFYSWRARCFSELGEHTKEDEDRTRARMLDPNLTS
jgi:tetratricopeptide (TPR) repeat protein